MSDTKIDVNGKNVMDIGCGHGLLGIAALKNDAKCCYFQDYNKVVLDSITTATITLNNLPLSNCKFIFGDWDTMN
jgi:ribosomal protein L11 methylase PrmA